MRWRSDRSGTLEAGPTRARAGASDTGLVDVLSEAVIAVDAEGTVTYASPAVTPLLGWEPEDLRRQPVVTIIPERLRSGHRVAFGRFMASGEGRILGRSVRLSALHQDGHEV